MIYPDSEHGDPSETDNHRPTPLGLIWESIQNCQLRSFKREELLSNPQYGYPSRHSTGDLLALVPYSWLDTLDNPRETHVVSLDIPKTFGQFWHLLWSH